MCWSFVVLADTHTFNNLYTCCMLSYIDFISQLQNHVGFLHEELAKLPSFPRKALDAEFSLYSGDLGKVLRWWWTLFNLCRILHALIFME